jgi:hypothetical protein
MRGYRHHAGYFYGPSDIRPRRLCSLHSLLVGEYDIGHLSSLAACGYRSRGRGCGNAVGLSPLTGTPACLNCINGEISALRAGFLDEELDQGCDEPECEYYDSSWRYGRSDNVGGGYFAPYL